MRKWERIQLLWVAVIVRETSDLTFHIIQGHTVCTMECS